MNNRDQDLLTELKSNQPNYENIRRLLTGNKEILTQILDDSDFGTPLHIAAKIDTRNGTNITKFLIEEFNANPNIKNNGDSIPLYWAFAELNACKNPSLNAIKCLLYHPKFYMNKKSVIRKSVLEFVREHYFNSARGEMIKMLVENKIWHDRLPSILLYKEIKQNYV
ncbi:unnamed protein product [Blepharisma stoltei]|uniref:Ankyrin repeat protein n=1 Tax=Blepharisma stoltei TaxID=1481888 RepID=A0AAU9I9J8_9CILI|nr:unnamed protein product [Blepharisma stoltei]